MIKVYISDAGSVENRKKNFKLQNITSHPHTVGFRAHLLYGSYCALFNVQDFQFFKSLIHAHVIAHGMTDIIHECIIVYC